MSNKPTKLAVARRGKTASRLVALQNPALSRAMLYFAATRAIAQTDRAIQSVLDQKGAHVFLHLVDDGGGGAEVVRRYSGLNHVFTYANPVRRGALRTLHELVPRLRSSFVAVQDPGTVSTPDAAPIRGLDARGLRCGISGGPGEYSVGTRLSRATAD